MYDFSDAVASTTALGTELAQSGTQIFVSVLALMVGVLILMIGAGFAISRFRRYVAGKKA